MNFPNKKFKHGLWQHPLYAVWAAMKYRCNNPNSKQWKDYGGRGIVVCDEWENFEPFYEWAIQAGWTKGAYLDRRKVNEGYGPKNCRFIAPRHSATNRRTTVLTPDLISAIKELRSKGLWCKEIASLFGIGKTTVVDASNGHRDLMNFS